LRLGALNRGEFGRFQGEVIAAENQDGEWVGPRSWPVPWLEDGSATSKDIAKFGKPLLDFAHFDLFGLQEDLDSTKWMRGVHWVFPSRPEPVKFRYSAVRAWPDLGKQYVVITLRVIRDEPAGMPMCSSSSASTERGRTVWNCRRGPHRARPCRRTRASTAIWRSTAG
jgi:hypothetical protein